MKYNKQFSIISDKTGHHFNVESDDLPNTIIWENMPVCYEIEKTKHGYKVSHITFMRGYDD